MKQHHGILGALLVVLELAVIAGSSTKADASAPPPLRIQTHVDRWNLPIDEELELRVEIHGVYDRYIPPTFPDFELIGSFKKVRSEMRKGSQYKWREVHYRLRPKALDRLVIGGARIKMGNKLLAEGQELIITVTNPPAAVSAQESRKNDTSSPHSTALWATTDKEKYWVGEPIVVSWDLLSLEGQDVRPVSVERAPRMQGVARRDNLVFETTPRDVDVNGKKRRLRPYSKVVAFKHEPGQLVIDAMRLLVKTDDGFGQARLVTRPFYVDVKALPKGQPPSFMPHQLGSFELQSRVLDTNGQKAMTAKAGDVFYVEAQVKGRGNIRGIQPPKLEGAEYFHVRQIAAVRDETFRKDTTGISGTRQFRFELKPRVVGTVPLPKVTFAFFDPQKEAYVVRRHTHGSVKVESIMQLLQGGQLLEGAQRRGLRLEAGWPHISLTYVLPVLEGLELSPKVKVRYGHLLEANTAALEPGLDLRWKLLDYGRWKLALVGDPGLIMNFPSDAESMEFGFKLGVPGLMASIQLANEWNLSLGLRIPLAFMLGDTSRMLIPVLADAGFDTMLVDENWNLNVGALMSAGPEFCVGTCEGVGTHLRFSVTTSVIW